MPCAGTDWSRWSQRLAGSRAARLAALPVRVKAVGRYDAGVVYESIRWLVRSKEHTNYTYALTPRNMEHLAWFVCECVDCDIATARGWISEIETDKALKSHISQCASGGPRAGLADETAWFGRRIVWYAIVRASRPACVVESGIDKGLGTCVLASALIRNRDEGHPGVVAALDINPSAGYMVSGRYADVVRISHGDSLRLLGSIHEPIDLFIHDSNHSPEHEAAELKIVAPKLSRTGIVISDNVMQSDELARFAEAIGQRTLFFREEPDHHWWPGEGVGVVVLGKR